MAVPDSNLSRRERKKLETRERLLVAAWQHFNRKGFDATTVEEITQAADVAKGTFFNYFETKEQVLHALVVWGIQRLSRLLDPALGAPSSPVARLKLLMRTVLDHLSANNGLIGKALLSHLRRMDREDPEHSLLPMIQELVAEAQAVGEIRPDAEASLVTRLLLCSCWPEMKESVPVDVDARIDLILDGLAGPEWRA